MQAKHQDNQSDLITPSRHSLGLEWQSIDAVAAAHFGQGLVRPLYESFCFSNLTGFIEQALLGETSRSTLPDEVYATVGQHDHVVMIFFDAFGWESFERFREHGTLQAFEKDGIVMKSTAQFPSTTAAHVTTIATGMPVFEHTICGWDYYEPRVGRVIRPLPFVLSDERTPDSLVKLGVEPQELFEPGDFYPGLLKQNITVRSHGPSTCFPSSYNSRFLPREHLIGYASPVAGIENVLQNIRAHSESKTYDLIYFDLYDTICHRSQPFSEEADTAAREILSAIYGLIATRVPQRTLIILSADHGQIADRADGVIRINELVPDLESALKRDVVGNPIRFTGSPRNFFLHPRPDAEAAVIVELRNLLKGAAEVMSVEELTNNGLLGPRPPTPALLERLGTVGVLAHPGYAVTWNEPPIWRHKDRSGHGGACAAEMETPLLLLSR